MPLLSRAKPELGQAAQDLFLQLFLGGDLGLQEEVAVLVQQRRQFVAAQGTAIEHGQRIATWSARCSTRMKVNSARRLGGLVDLGAHLLGHEVVEAARIADQSKPRARNSARYWSCCWLTLGIALGLAAGQVIAPLNSSRKMGASWVISLRSSCMGVARGRSGGQGVGAQADAVFEGVVVAASRRWRWKRASRDRRENQ